MIHSQSTRTPLTLLAPLALLILWGIAARAAAPAEPAAPATTIEIKGFAFAPRTLTITAGTTVTWRNLDAEPHTVRGGDELVRSGALDQDESYSVRIDKPGTYHYGCSIHPQMSGTIIVQ
jgi:plastocyanin